LSGGKVAYHAEGNIDKIIRLAFFLGMKRGVFVEVGAAHPEYISISKHFRDAGWRVISVEPNPVFAEAHRGMGHEIYECACADYEEDNADFTVVETIGHDRITNESYSAIKVLDDYKNKDKESFNKTHSRTIKINIRKLDTILSSANVSFIDVLSVDVEGWEISVLNGLNTVEHPFSIGVIENWLKDESYRDYMRKRGYLLAFTNFPNDVYVLQGRYGMMRILWAKICNAICR
jgi:FkbM family methyltransferase